MSHTFDKADTGYTAGFYDGKAAERKRIVELLEPLGCPDDGIAHNCQNGLGYTTAADLITLIEEKIEVNSENLKTSLKKIFKPKGKTE